MCPLFIMNGGWNAWSGLSPCARSRGGGQQYQSRLGCNPFTIELLHTVATHIAVQVRWPIRKRKKQGQC